METTSVLNETTHLVSAKEAAGLLLWVMEVLQDSGVEERLFALDAACKGELASWQPPWAEDPVDELTLEQVALTPSVVNSAMRFAACLAPLELQAKASPSVDPDHDPVCVVVPEVATEWQWEVIQLLVQVCGGECVRHGEWNAKRVLSSGTRVVNLGQLEPPKSAASAQQSCTLPARTRPSNIGPTLKPGFLAAGRTPPQSLEEEAEEDILPETSKQQVPCIQFIHLDALNLGMNVLGEAAALIMGTMQLINHACVKQALAVLDDLSGGLVTSWKPPWSGELIETPTLERLSPYPESTLLGWAMNVDAFVSFLARFAAAAMKSGWIPGRGYPQATSTSKVEELDWRDKADLPNPCTEESVAAVGVEAAVQVDDDDDDDGWEVEPPVSDSVTRAVQQAEVADKEPPEEPEKVSPIVAVLPDVATQWHLDVIGALVSSLGVFMIYERAWRADFSGQGNVPFSVEALPSSSTEGQQHGGIYQASASSSSEI